MRDLLLLMTSFGPGFRPHPRGNMEQILIVEDDTDINNMMASALTKVGYECKQAF